MTTLDTSTPVFVLRRKFGVFHHGGLAVQRTLGRLGVKVYGVHEDRGAPAAVSRYSRGRMSIDEDAPEERWVEALLDVGRRIGRAVLIPVDDTASAFVEENAAALRERFLFPEQPEGLPARLSGKRRMFELCQELDIPAPPTAFPAGEDDLPALAERFGYPVVLKQSDGWLPSRDPAAPSVCIAAGRDEMVAMYRAMESDVQPNVIVQEYIPGRSDTIWMFNGYFDRDSRCLVGFTGRKVRQRGPHTGPTTLGECVPNEDVADATCKLAAATGYRGIIDIGYRYDARDGSSRLLDVNPRMGGSFRLFVGQDGMDVVRALYMDLTGQSVPESAPSHGRRWIVEPFDLISSAQLAREGSLTAREWLRSFRGVQEGAWFAADDPLPFLTMGVRMLPLAARRAGL